MADLGGEVEIEGDGERQGEDAGEAREKVKVRVLLDQVLYTEIYACYYNDAHDVYKKTPAY